MTVTCSNCYSVDVSRKHGCRWCESRAARERGEEWYRFDDKRYSVSDDDGDHLYSTVKIVMHKFIVVRHTPKGVWLMIGFGDRRFVRHDATRRFACPTIEEAKESFIKRKEKQASIYRARMNSAEQVIKMIQNDRNSFCL